MPDLATPRHNLEFKARLYDAFQAEDALRGLGAASVDILVQRDTYFHVPHGRLKLREMPDRAELIRYIRDESGPSMSSRYTISPVDRPAATRSDLAARHGVRGVIEKTRSLWIYRNARIHLDHVAGLGSFLEIEVVEPHTSEEGEVLLEHLRHALSLDPDAAVRTSYIDLLEAATDRGQG